MPKPAPVGEPAPIGGPAPAGERATRRSLGTSLVLVVGLVNLVVFAAVLLFAADAVSDARAESQRRAGTFVDGLLRDLSDGADQLRVRSLLRLSDWEPFEDVVVAQAPVADGAGRLAVTGVFVNPLGRGHRPSTFDEQAVLGAIANVAERDRPISLGQDEYAHPIVLSSGERWGGCWYRIRREAVFGDVLAKLAPWFVVSMLLSTLVTLVAVRRRVLDPVNELAHAASRLESGDLSARAQPPRTENELTALALAFNDMAQQVEHFSAELAHEVRVATDQARTAEAAAMTQRRLAATGELAAGIAHEVNNPLGGMLNALERLEREDLPDDRRREYNALLRGGLERVRLTVGRLLRLSPRAAGPLDVGDVRLAEPIGDALGLVKHRANGEGVRVLLREDSHGGGDAFEPEALARLAELPPVRGAANELGQAVLNLLVNALDALEERREREGGPAPGGDEIRITLEALSDRQRIVVEDNGPGVDEETLARAADAFFTTKEQGRGTGLGLAIVHHVADAHGGRVLLSSRVGHGFRAEIELPLDPARPLVERAGGPDVGADGGAEP